MADSPGRGACVPTGAEFVAPAVGADEADEADEAEGSAGDGAEVTADAELVALTEAAIDAAAPDDAGTVELAAPVPDDGPQPAIDRQTTATIAARTPGRTSRLSAG